MTDQKSKILEFIKEGVVFIGASAGIILAAIGLIMLLQAVLKLYVLDIQAEDYASYMYKCDRYDPDAPAIAFDTPRLVVSKKVNNQNKLTEKERKDLQVKYEKCKQEVQKEEHKRFVNHRKSDIADGIAFSVVGLAFLYFFRRKRK